MHASGIIAEDKNSKIYCPNVIPDITHKNAISLGKHRLYEQKVVNPVSAGASGTSVAASLAAFATRDDLERDMRGAEATATQMAVAGQYEAATTCGHALTMIITDLRRHVAGSGEAARLPGKDAWHEAGC